MNREINLLRSQKKSFLQKAAFLNRFRLVAFSMLGIVAVLSVIVFFLIITSVKTSLLQEKENANKRLAALDKKSLQVLLVKTNLKDIESFLGKKSSLDVIIQFISAYVPSSIKIDLLSIDKKSVTMNITGSSLPAFTEFFDKLITLGIQQKLFDRVIIDSFSVDPSTSMYMVSLTIVIL